MIFVLLIKLFSKHYSDVRFLAVTSIENNFFLTISWHTLLEQNTQRNNVCITYNLLNSFLFMTEKFDFDRNKSKQILISLIVVWPTVVERAYNPSTESQQ